MTPGVVILDSDTLSELSRGNARVRARAAEYLDRHGALTITAISVFERLRGYREAIRQGKPFEEHLRKFQALVATCRVLPVDEVVADHAATIWTGLPRRSRRALGDILIAATASAFALSLATRNSRHFLPMARIAGARLTLVDWSR
jgi:predicted nucleic acid-binding protein